MSYRLKIQEFQKAAQRCVKTAQYNTAANRYYYAAFLLLKNAVSPEDDSPASHGDILRDYYTKMYEQDTPVSKEDSSALKKSWAKLYKHRLIADYRTDMIDIKRASESKEALSAIKEVLWNN